MGDDTPAALGALHVDETRLKGHVDEVVRSSVEETLNGLLDAEADEICGAQRYERSADRVDGRAGHYERKLETKAGEVKLRIPKLRRLPFETAIIERYKRREASVEEALVEMYLAGVSVRRVEDITEALWGTRLSSGTVSRLNQKIYRHIEAWRNREIVGDFPYLYLDGVILKRSWAGEVRNISVLIAIGVGTDGFRQILGVSEGEKEDLEGWRGFLRHLKDRGLKGVRLIISDACRGLVEAAAEVFPQTDWQRCVVHFYRNVFSHTPNGKVAEVARMLKAIHAQESGKTAQAKATEVAARLKEMKLRTAAELVEQKVNETLTYYAYPSTHWRQIRTNNPLERIIREIRRRTRVVGAFPDGHSALMLVAARLRHIASTKWGRRRYMVMDPLLNPAKQEAAA
jgi:putative transposase